MGLLKSISKSMKGTFVGDLAKSADKAIDATSSFIGDCIDETFNEVCDSAKSLTKGAKNVAKGAGKIGRVVTGYEAYDSRKKAKEAKELADRMVANIEEENRRRREESNRVLSDFGKTKLELLKTCLSPFLGYLKVMGNNYKDKEYEFGGKINLDQLDIDTLESIEMNASTAGKIAVASTGVATIALCGVPAATTSAVMAFGAASTGTAISSLSGAAATNATLAWLGGGSLAAGGGGMAAGSAVLGAITATTTGVFALAAAGIVASAYYSKKYTEATAYLEEVKKARAKAKLGWTAMEAINQRAIELESVMKRLGERINDKLLYLEPLIYGFQTEDEYYLNTFRETSLLVKSLSEIAQVPLIDKNGMLSNESSFTLANTQKILNNSSFGFRFQAV